MITYGSHLDVEISLQSVETTPATITFMTIDDPACSLCLKLNFSARVLHGNGKKNF
jgi:hypothetical protein